MYKSNFAFVLPKGLTQDTHKYLYSTASQQQESGYVAMKRQLINKRKTLPRDHVVVELPSQAIEKGLLGSVNKCKGLGFPHSTFAMQTAHMGCMAKNTRVVACSVFQLQCTTNESPLSSLGSKRFQVQRGVPQIDSCCQTGFTLSGSSWQGLSLEAPLQEEGSPHRPPSSGPQCSSRARRFSNPSRQFS
eukprot:TRINITY_DN17903_c0_g1_i1.p1 TRINITY_DN17903_c0_g1~~TRINITY_DN17903_c0_g1_i1.p1  ORF type:complete len:189 (-),score=3.38 TRINITY_DN17903_c0_g1_i1:290-856(-)